MVLVLIGLQVRKPDLNRSRLQLFLFPQVYIAWKVSRPGAYTRKHPTFNSKGSLRKRDNACKPNMKIFNVTFIQPGWFAYLKLSCLIIREVVERNIDSFCSLIDEHDVSMAERASTHILATQPNVKTCSGKRKEKKIKTYCKQSIPENAFYHSLLSKTSFYIYCTFLLSLNNPLLQNELLKVLCVASFSIITHFRIPNLASKLLFNLFFVLDVAILHISKHTLVILSVNL